MAPNEQRLQQRLAVVTAVRKYRGDFTAAAKALGTNPGYVKRWYNQITTVGHANDRARSGRPPVFPAEVTDKVVDKVLELQSFTAATRALIATGDLPAHISRSTVYTNVIKRGIKLKWGPQSYIPNITPLTVAKRLAFAKCHLQHGTDWCSVMAIDSCMFRLDRVGGLRGVWRLVGEPVESSSARPSYSKKGSLHVYAGITAFGKTPLVFVSGTSNMAPRYKSAKGQLLKGVGAAEFQHVLGKHLIPEAQDIFSTVEAPAWQLLMDRAPAHTAASTQQWLLQNGVHVVQGWPGNSPDLNPIENLWGWLKAKLYRMQLNNIPQLKAALLQLWDQVPDYMLTKLMSSMERRLQTVVARQGGYTGR